VRVDQVVLTPAQRVDVWMDFSTFAAGARPQLLSADLAVESAAMGGMGGMGGMGAGGAASSSLTLDPRVAATFVVAEGDARPGTAPVVLGPRPTVSVADAVNANAPKQVMLATQGMMTHTINGRTWQDRSVTPAETVTAGTTEVWELVNNSPMPHPIHLHGNPFRVVQRTWDDATLEAAWKTIETGVVETGRRDTVLVWPGQRVRIVVPIAKHEGFFLYHCHVLEHEDAGMMRSFRVVGA
jgi:FtsP/CotA-like multicopper oxidase with cupredoxin domain